MKGIAGNLSLDISMITRKQLVIVYAIDGKYHRVPASIGNPELPIRKYDHVPYLLAEPAMVNVELCFDWRVAEVVAEHFGAQWVRLRDNRDLLNRLEEEDNGFQESVNFAEDLDINKGAKKYCQD